MDWAGFRSAVRRWEELTGRAAPYPVVLDPAGRPRLSMQFTEWMMGLPAGHVTGVPGLTEPEQLKLLGNGVVPQQAAAALGWLLQQVPAGVLADLLAAAPRAA